MKQEQFYQHFYGNSKIIITVGDGAYFSNAVCERAILKHSLPQVFSGRGHLPP